MNKLPTKFVIVNPKAKALIAMYCDDVDEIYSFAGLPPLEVDHGVVRPGIGVVVYEFGLFADPKDISYFAMEGQLFAGNAVLYGYDVKSGETRDVEDIPVPLWLEGQEGVEAAIAAGLVARPIMAVNGVVTWQWPDARNGQ
jgi:hypothetical protein